MADFNPYHKWLGIPAEEQPASYYRLLGIANFEMDADVIETAAERQTLLLRTFQTGPNSELAERLLNEISAARVCLLDGKSKARYDTQLRTAQQPVPEEDPLAFPTEELAAVSSKPATRSRQRSRGGKPVWKEPWAIPAAAGGVVVLLLLMMLIFGSGEEPQGVRQGQEEGLRAEIASLKQKLVTAGNSKGEENAELAKQNTELSQHNAGLKTEVKELALQKSATSLANAGPKKQISDDAVSFVGHRYLLVDRGVTWSAARRESEQRGGYLVKLDSIQEHEFLINHLNEKPPKNENGHIWINGSRLIDGGKYLFTDDRPVDFSQMRTTPFSRPEGREMFLAMFEPHGWHVQDVVFHHKGFHAFIIEWEDDENPTSFSPRASLPASLQKGLIAYCPFNGDANDESGNGNHGEVHGAALSADRHGKDATAYQFDGRSHISVLVKNLPLENNARTVTCWFKAHQVVPKLLCLFSYGLYQEDDGFYGVLYGRPPHLGQLTLGNAGGKDEVHGAVVPELNAWHQCVITYESGRALVYLNGLCIAQSNKRAYTTSGNKLFRIGHFFDTSKYKYSGFIDDVRIYNRALSEAEVKALYEFEKP